MPDQMIQIAPQIRLRRQYSRIQGNTHHACQEFLSVSGFDSNRACALCIGHFAVD
jgi:hypothetical protein